MPPLPEQTAIASFLDAETSKIDSLVSEQRRLIELLKEKRQAVISRAVTKGLNPDVKMKDSGIDSIGDIPKHWTLKSLALSSKRIAVGLATSVTKYYRDDGVPIIRNKNIKEGYFDGSDMLYLDEAFAESQSSKAVRGGDVITVHTGSNLGLTCVVPNEYDQCHTFTTLIVTPNDELLNRYFTFCMNSLHGKAEVSRLKFGFGKDNLNVRDFKFFNTLLPSFDEQVDICSFLDAELLKFDGLVAQAERAIELLQERRTALISAAVTGKIDVREFAYQETA